ncbi:unnamed protein product [Gadus morhua 'NCC']
MAAKAFRLRPYRVASGERTNQHGDSRPTVKNNRASLLHDFSMTDPLVDQMTKLRLKLIEKKLSNERNRMDERTDSVQSSRTYDGEMYALHGAQRRKRDLLQRLREQYMLEELRRPRTWGGPQRRRSQPQHHHRHADHFPSSPPPYPAPFPYQPTPGPVVIPFLLPPIHVPAQPPHIQHISTIPQQQPTFIQQVPLQQQPMSQPAPPPQNHGRSIKEDMVEMMLMQNAQMHQIVMQNMMLKALPPLGFPGSERSGHATGHTGYLEQAGAFYHHHHYSQGPAALPPLPPIGYPAWPPMMSSPAQGGHPHTGPHLHVPSMHFYAKHE